MFWDLSCAGASTHPELPADLLWDGCSLGNCHHFLLTFNPFIFPSGSSQDLQIFHVGFPHCCDQHFLWKIFTPKPGVTGALPAPVPGLESLDVPWEVTSPLVSLPHALMFEVTLKQDLQRTFIWLILIYKFRLNSLFWRRSFFAQRNANWSHLSSSSVNFWDINEFGAWDLCCALNLGLPKASGAESEICLQTSIKPPDNEFFNLLLNYDHTHLQSCCIHQ